MSNPSVGKSLSRCPRPFGMALQLLHPPIEGEDGEGPGYDIDYNGCHLLWMFFCCVVNYIIACSVAGCNLSLVLYLVLVPPPLAPPAVSCVRQRVKPFGERVSLQSAGCEEACAVEGWVVLLQRHCKRGDHCGHALNLWRVCDAVAVNLCLDVLCHCYIIFACHLIVSFSVWPRMNFLGHFL